MKKQSSDYVGKVRCTKSVTSCFTVGKIYDFPSPTDDQGDKRLGVEILDGGMWSFEPMTQEQIEKDKSMRTINYNQAQLIIDIACSTWKERLFDKWGKAIVLKNAINISEEDYQSMRDACTDAQHDLFDDIFGKDEPKYKIGDWVIDKPGDYGAKQVLEVGRNKLKLTRGNGIYSFDYCRLATPEEIKKANAIPEGTACLVRDSNDSPWKLAYSNGNGNFDSGTSVELSWNQVLVLDMDNLPAYSKK